MVKEERGVTQSDLGVFFVFTCKIIASHALLGLIACNYASDTSVEVPQAHLILWSCLSKKKIHSILNVRVKLFSILWQLDYSEIHHSLGFDFILRLKKLEC